ncbi:hypothetical protein RE6C_05894 [Rhodopirellula europaea 6C]|uniref:Uncharacterized protein n=1 Tax=Rhodopirellula europaea 6C TaxID=1263867 RepID=M2A3A3_9BACT|nr:hypothetical protein RE6C_05894 [Rhodopirellula europaea 6C]
MFGLSSSSATANGELDAMRQPKTATAFARKDGLDIALDGGEGASKRGGNTVSLLKDEHL